MKRKAKRRMAHSCSECGAQAAAHEGRCHSCGAYETMQKGPVEKGSALPSEAQAVVEVLTANLKGETRKSVTQTVELLLRPRAEGGVGVTAEAASEAAQEMLDEHLRSPKDRPLGFMVALARRGRKPKKHPRPEDVVESWKPMSSLKQIVEKMDLPSLAAAGQQNKEDESAKRAVQVQAQPAAAKDDDCPKCGGARYVWTPEELRRHGTPAPCPGCCQEPPAARRARFLRMSGIEGPMAQMTLDTVNLTASVTEGVAAVRLLVAGEISQLVLIGGPGRGKTHLAVAAMIACIDKGMSALYLNTARFLDQLRSSYSPDVPTEFEDVIRPALTWDMVVLDDLAGERRTDWAQEKLFEIVDTRYAKELRTVACSNCPMRAWDPRVVSRLSDQRRGVVVTLSGDDYRLRPIPPK